MIVQFDGAVVSRVRVNKSKKGNEYAIIKLIYDFEQYELFCFAGDEVEIAKQLPVKVPLNLVFDLMPQEQNGGVRLSLIRAFDEEGCVYGLPY